jgi:hypothetical protein
MKSDNPEAQKIADCLKARNEEIKANKSYSKILADLGIQTY